MNFPLKPNRRQMDFFSNKETEAWYEGENHMDSIYTLCHDAFIKALQSYNLCISIFTTSTDEVNVIEEAICSYVSWAIAERGDKCTSIRFMSGSMIQVFSVQDDEDDLWRFGGAEWQGAYFFEPKTFTENQIAYLKTRLRRYRKIKPIVRYIETVKE